MTRPSVKFTKYNCIIVKRVKIKSNSEPLNFKLFSVLSNRILLKSYLYKCIVNKRNEFLNFVLCIKI